MPRTKRPKPLYHRGGFSLYRRSDRPNLEIVWYDTAGKRERSASAGTANVGEGRTALDRRYRESLGNHHCPKCGRLMDGDAAPLLLSVILDYLTGSEGKAGHAAAKTRLGHVVGYIGATNPAVTVPMIGEAWVDGFRKWMDAKGYAPGNIEGCVLQLAAAVNGTHGHKAQFKARSLKEAAQSPTYRADVVMMAAMFRFCLYPKGRSDKERAMIADHRKYLLAYLRAAVATWARPDAIFGLKAKGQWHSAAGVLALNPPGRRQTKKYRPSIPVAHQFRPWLDDALDRDNYLPVSTVRHSWEAMRIAIGMPGEGEAGMKLIRRTMATLVRRRIGEAQWQQGEMMLGHVKASISDLYAIPDPANLGLALAATEAIIDEIEALTPGAFYRNITADAKNVIPLKVVKNG